MLQKVISQMKRIKTEALTWGAGLSIKFSQALCKPLCSLTATASKQYQDVTFPMKIGYNSKGEEQQVTAAKGSLSCLSFSCSGGETS